jgi:hypothetical protein
LPISPAKLVFFFELCKKKRLFATKKGVFNLLFGVKSEKKPPWEGRGGVRWGGWEGGEE